MPQTINVPGYGDVDFPDGMNDDQIVDAIKKLPAPPGQHGTMAKIAHYGAMALPIAGSMVGGVMGGGAGAALGFPTTGPGGIATTLAGASAGAGLLGGAGRAAQHSVDQALGYEQPMTIAQGAKDVGAYAGKEAAFTGLGGVALADAAAIASKAGPAMDTIGNFFGRRVLSGPGKISVRKPLSPDVINEAYQQGAFKPGGTSQSASDALEQAEQKVGENYGDVVSGLEEAGATGPNARRLGNQLNREATDESGQTLMSPQPTLFRRAANELLQKPTDEAGNLSLSQAENMKRTLQFQAKKEYDKITRQLSPMGEAKKALASRLRQSIEDAVESQTTPAESVYPRPIRSGDVNVPELRRSAEMILRGHLLPPSGEIGPVQPSAISTEFAPPSPPAPPESDVSNLAKLFVPVKQQYGRVAKGYEAAEEAAARATQRLPFGLPELGIGIGELAHGGTVRGLAAALAVKALRSRGPSTLAWALKGGANALADPALAENAASGGAKLAALLEALRQNRSSADEQ